ncbi:RT_RNaseH_2 domain-containing protein [Trichonephila inaurata madagascariensis]|uniref:RT_RNaseH_2 domain-containing protein n=1 Tax=Trichonephila inaurata madagascariensis TaxID=2747483 RepID=A0A8X6JST4_9ARAC|nr:RT_RNaseH_2 domain-containing protein [Trichonephila inaurata madagascariensis]
MLNYYRRFIRQAAHILAPLVNFLKGIRNKKCPKRNVKIKPEEVLQWTNEATTAFELVKQALAHALLHHPMTNAPLSIWVDASDFATRLLLPAIKPVSFLREKMRALQPIPTSAHSNSSMFVPTNLKSCSHVFLRVDSVQPPLLQNYTGPHEVIRRIDKVFTILINGRKQCQLIV